eukprot:TRINITY_DN6570_c0_g1_i1.p1 TRINITY_DN6570_c0_g1~~TRINITY_DN6570_c0_g1_i1.p1  ORF type:complete len:103 (-),score=13.33 TRINITY_DN6570_c0_g1_i1:28-336(-)
MTDSLKRRYLFAAETKEHMRDWQKVLQKATKFTTQKVENLTDLIYSNEKEVGSDGVIRRYRTPSVLSAVTRDTQVLEKEKVNRIVRRLERFERMSKMFAGTQ